MKKVFKFKIVIITNFLALFLVSSCHEKSHEKEESKFLVTHPWRESLSLSKDFVAQISAIQHIELRAFEKGYLQEIYVDEGQKVEKGDKLFQLMPQLMQAEAQKAQAEYDLEKIEYKNTKILADEKVVSPNELALAKAKLEKAKASFELAKTHLDLTTITAPFTGIIDRFRVRLGSLVDEGELLTTLADNTKMWVYFNVSESEYLDYMKVKQEDKNVELKLRLANGDIFDQLGKIDTIEADFNVENGNVAFRASFPNPDALLRHGETGSVLLVRSLQNALVIPQKATFEVLDKKFVYVIDKDHKVQSRQITVSDEVPHLFVVSSGLNEEDEVLLEGLGKVELGQKVEVEMQKPTEVVEGLRLTAE